MSFFQELISFRQQIQDAKNFDNKPYLKKVDKLFVHHRYLAKQVFGGVIIGLLFIGYGLYSSWNLLTLENFSEQDPLHFESHKWEEGYYKFQGTLLDQHIVIKEKNFIKNFILKETLIYFFTPVVSENYKAGEKVHLLIPIQQSQIDNTEKKYPGFRENATPTPLGGVVKRDASQEVIDQLLKNNIDVDKNVGILHQTSVKKDFQYVLFFSGSGAALILLLTLFFFLARRVNKKELEKIKKEVSQFGVF